MAQPIVVLSNRKAANVNTVILGVRGLDESLASFRDTWGRGTPQLAARINFATPELLWRTLTAKRWEILKTMCGQRALSIREIARRVGRDVKAVHGDVRALTLAGVLDKTETGKILFPYDALHVDFLLRAA